jgi:hypothetical protein
MVETEVLPQVGNDDCRFGHVINPNPVKSVGFRTSWVQFSASFMPENCCGI